MLNGLDISHWQGKPDFDKIKKTGLIDFIILKAGGSDAKNRYIDKEFERNYNECKRVGIPVGAYFFVGANFDGIKDAEFFLKILKGKQFEYPVFIDVESMPSSYKKRTTNETISFCEHMEINGYYVGIYSSDISGFKERLDINLLTPYDKWVARYSKNPPSYVKQWGIWQHSSHGNIDGINTRVDLNVSQRDYTRIIPVKHFNGF